MRKDVWLSDLIESVGRNEKVVVPCCVAQVAKAVYKVLVEAFPDRASKIQLFTQDCNKEQREQDLVNVQHSW